MTVGRAPVAERCGDQKRFQLRGVPAAAERRQNFEHAHAAVVVKTGEACELIALENAPKRAVFNAVTDVRAAAVMIDGRSQRRMLLRQRADVRRDRTGGALFS